MAVRSKSISLNARLKVEIDRTTSFNRFAIRAAAVVIGLFVLLFLFLYNLPYFPVTWLDEGFVLQGAMNLVRYGQYAMKSAEGFRILDQPLIANGPGVVLPIALAFRLFGIGIVQARLVIVAFGLATFAVSYGIVSKLYGRVAAWISLIILIGLPYEGFLFYGRQALGNMPGLFYFVLGYILWIKAIERKNLMAAAGAGLLWGLAMVTKGQFLLLLPVVCLAFLVERYYYKQAVALRYLAMAGSMALCLGAWQVFQLVMIGPEHYSRHLETIRSSLHVTILAFQPVRIPGNVFYMVRSGLGLFIFPAWLYTAWQCYQKRPGSALQLILVLIIPTWLTWYAFVSVGWARYAFDPFTLGLLLTGKFTVDLYAALRGRLPGKEHTLFNSPWLYKAGWGLLVAMTIGVCWGYAHRFQQIAQRPNTDAFQFADYLLQTLDKNSVVETWEWELDALADLNYHHPTNDWVDEKTAEVQYGKPSTTSYDLTAYHPDYLIDGPFSKFTGLYKQSIDSGCCRYLHSTGMYDLYQVIH